MTGRSARILLVALLLGVLAVVTPASDAGAAFPGENGLLAFESNAGGSSFQIRLMTPDGLRVAERTTQGAFGPAWSPDGTAIAFSSGRSGASNEIYRMNRDGSGVTRLTDNALDDFGPAWSPDGDRIAFGRNDGPNSAIWVMDADGTDPTRLTDSSADDYDAAWSPDGDRIAFSSSRDAGDYEIYVMSPNGADPTRLTTSVGLDVQANWSPDGNEIVFMSTRDGNAELYTMQADGTGVTRLTDNTAEDSHPVWSPDGTRIAFGRVGDTIESRIMVMDADGGNVTELTSGSYDTRVDWQAVPSLDTVAPTATITEPAAGNERYEQGSLVPAAYTCADAEPGTGVATCTGIVEGPRGTRAVANGAPLPTSAAGDHVLTVTATDNALNPGEAVRQYTVVRHRPDGRVRVGTGAQLGDDVVNTTGARQTAVATAARGHQITFNLSIQNDGSVVDRFRLLGQPSSTNYTVRYYAGATGRNITGAVTAGAYRTTDLAPTASFSVRVVVAVKASAPAGSSVTRSLTATSLGLTAKKDVVRMTVRRA